MTTDHQIDVDLEITLLDDDLSDELEAAMLSGVKHRRLTSKGFSGLTEIVILVSGSVTFAIKTFEWLRARWQQDTIIDLRKGKVEIKELDKRTGQTIIVAPDGTVTEYSAGRGTRPAAAELGRLLPLPNVPPKP